MHQDLSFYDEVGVGTITSRIQNDAGASRLLPVCDRAVTLSGVRYRFHPTSFV
jgi:hypothetical protein